MWPPPSDLPFPARPPALMAVLLVACVWLAGTARAGDHGPPGGAARPMAGPAMVAQPARGMLLVAADKLRDPNFARSVVLLLDYGEDGAMGLVLNRRLRVPLAALVPELQQPTESAPTLYLGGPVGLGRVTLLVSADRVPAESRRILEGVYVSASMTTLEQLLDGDLPEAEARAYVGHAGWAPGQLEVEIGRGDWDVVRAHPEHVFAADGGALWERLRSAWRGHWVRAGPSQPSPRAVSRWTAPLPSTTRVHSMEAQQTGQSS